MTRRGITLVEVLAMAVLGLVLGVPIFAALRVNTVSTAATRETAFAAALAERAIAETLARPWPELAAALPLHAPVGGLAKADEEFARRWPEYAGSATGDRAPSGSLEVEAAGPALMAITVQLSWPVAPGASARHELSVVRLRSRPEHALITTAPLTSGVPLDTPDRHPDAFHPTTVLPQGDCP